MDPNVARLMMGFLTVDSCPWWTLVDGLHAIPSTMGALWSSAMSVPDLKGRLRQGDRWVEESTKVLRRWKRDGERELLANCYEFNFGGLR